MRSSGFIGLALIGLLIHASAASAQAPVVPDGPDSVVKARARIVLALPDSGGYYLNDTKFDRVDLDGLFAGVFGRRPAKVLLLAIGVHRDSADVRWVADLARAHAITVYRANLEFEEAARRSP